MNRNTNKVKKYEYYDFFFIIRWLFYSFINSFYLYEYLKKKYTNIYNKGGRYLV